MRHIEKSLALSTAHAPSSRPDFGNMRVAEHKYGWIVFVTKPDPGIYYGAWLNPILELALKENCTLINFDADADEVDGLKVYDW